MKIFVALFLIANLSSANAKSPKRVIVLSPALTEMIYALHFENTLVGVSDFSDYPEAAKTKPSVGPYNKPNMEKILNLKPDLVILAKEGPEDVKAQLDQLKIPYHVVTMNNLNAVAETAKSIALSLGDESRGLKFQKNWNSKLQSLFSNSPQKRAQSLIEIQKDPLIVAGQDTFLSEIVTRCGGVNTTTEKGYPHLSLESALHTPHDYIFLADYFPSAKERVQTVAWWKSQSRAQVVVLNPDLTARPGPRLLEGAREICEDLKKK